MATKKRATTKSTGKTKKTAAAAIGTTAIRQLEELIAEHLAKAIDLDIDQLDSTEISGMLVDNGRLAGIGQKTLLKLDHNAITEKTVCELTRGGTRSRLSCAVRNVVLDVVEELRDAATEKQQTLKMDGTTYTVKSREFLGNGTVVVELDPTQDPRWS